MPNPWDNDPIVGGGIQTKPADPKLPAEVQGLGLRNRQTAQDIDLAAQEAARKREADRRAKIELDASLYTKGLRINKAGGLEPIPGWKPPVSNAPDASRGAELRDRVTALGNMESGLGQLNSLYQKNLKGQPASRLFGATELLPDFMNPANAEFNKTAMQMGPYIMSILGLSGKSTDAAAEYKQKVMPFIPSAQSFDNVNERTLNNLRDMLARQKAATYKELGVPLPVSRGAPQKAAPKIIDFKDLP